MKRMCGALASNLEEDPSPHFNQENYLTPQLNPQNKKKKKINK
jgi:hypothetical protein